MAGFLRDGGHEVLDLGTDGPVSVDYPDFAEAVGLAVLDGRAERGVLLCGSGVGAAVAANKLWDGAPETMAALGPKYAAHPDGTVRQLWESSADGGSTWQAVFDGLYRKKS